MKKNILKTIAILSLAYFTVGCKKITNINTSPNDPPISSATPQILFPSAVASSAARIGGELNIVGGFWSQYYTQYTTANQFRTLDAYNLTRNDFTADWDELYSGALQDYQVTISTAKAKGLNNYVLMATCMKAYTLGVLADLYDQVPYKEALLGQANVQPHFDAGHDVYLGLIAEIDAALSANYNAPSGESADFIFNGDMTKWAQFANTLELKMYLRMINAYPAEAQAGVQKVYGNGIGFLTANAGMNNFVDAPNKDNPFYEYNQRSLNTTDNIKASITFISYLKANNDPRLDKYFEQSDLGGVVGINQGDYNGTNTTYGKSSNPLQKPTDPVWFISAAESYFLQAEAIVRYGVAGDATDMYNNGITASFEANGLTDGDASTYYGQSAIAYPAGGSSATKLKAILTQKWISDVNGCHALEGFFDQQRTGIPQISSVYSTDESYVPGQWVYSLNGVTTGKAFPKRLIFPETEYTTNKNTPKQVPLTTTVWWGLTGNQQ